MPRSYYTNSTRQPWRKLSSVVSWRFVLDDSKSFISKVGRFTDESVIFEYHSSYSDSSGETGHDLSHGTGRRVLAVQDPPSEKANPRNSRISPRLAWIRGWNSCHAQDGVNSSVENAEI